jgi:hypothetical protein
MTSSVRLSCAKIIIRTVNKCGASDYGSIGRSSWLTIFGIRFEGRSRVPLIQYYLVLKHKNV